MKFLFVFNTGRHRDLYRPLLKVLSSQGHSVEILNTAAIAYVPEENNVTAVNVHFDATYTPLTLAISCIRLLRIAVGTFDVVLVPHLYSFYNHFIYEVLLSKGCTGYVIQEGVYLKNEVVLQKSKSVRSITLRKIVLKAVELTFRKLGTRLGIGELFRKSGILCFGSFSRDYFDIFDIPERNYFITGSPLFEHEWQNYRKRSFAVRSETTTRILLVTQPLVANRVLSAVDYINGIKAIISAIQDIPDTSITIKLHPDEDMTLYEPVMGIDRVVIEKLPTMEDMVENSDLVLVIYSTAMLTALFRKRSVIVVDLWNNEFITTIINDFHRYSKLPMVTSTEQLRTIIVNLVTNPSEAEIASRENESFLEKVVIPGPATDNICKIITSQNGKYENRFT